MKGLVFVNGIYGDSEGLKRLADAVDDRSDITCRHYHYHWTGPIMAGIRGFQFRHARGLAEMISKQRREGHCVSVVAHSYGALITYRALFQDALLDKIFLFNPAMEANYCWPAESFCALHVIHNPHDRALLLGSWLPGHAFGRLGRIGYQGPRDRRIVNHSRPNKEGISHHGNELESPKVEIWADFITEKVEMWANFITEKLKE